MADEPTTGASEPLLLDLEAVKLNLRIDSEAEDDLISDLIAAAAEHIEDYTGLVLSPRQVVETVPSLARSIVLTSWPIASKDDIALTYFDHSGVEQTIDPSLWYVILAEKPAKIMSIRPGWGISFGLGSWLGSFRRSQPHILPFPATITIHAGYATPDLIPKVVKQAMQLLIAHLYTNRSAVEAGTRAAAIEIPLGVKDMLRKWRKRSV